MKRMYKTHAIKNVNLWPKMESWIKALAFPFLRRAPLINMRSTVNFEEQFLISPLFWLSVLLGQTWLNEERSWERRNIQAFTFFPLSISFIFSSSFLLMMLGLCNLTMKNSNHLFSFIQFFPKNRGSVSRDSVTNI